METSTSTIIARRDSYLRKRKSIITAIHKAIGEGIFYQVVKLIEDGSGNWPSDLLQEEKRTNTTCNETSRRMLLWESNSSAGWTACHFTASSIVPTIWWDWILCQAASASNEVQKEDCYNHNTNHHDCSNNNIFLNCKTALGQTIVDVFFRSYVRPLPWQSLEVKNRSKRFVRAVEQVMSEKISIDELRDHYETCRMRYNRFKENNNYKNCMSNNGRSLRINIIAKHPNHNIQRIVHFLIHLQILCRVIIQQENRSKVFDDDNNNESPNDSEVNFLDAISRTGNCPKLIARLLVKLFPIAEITTDTYLLRHDDGGLPNNMHQNTILPLHYWCTSHSEFPEEDGMVESLLGINNNCHSSQPTMIKEKLSTSAALIADPRTGTLPLLSAIQHGKSWYCIQPIFLAAPSVLRDTVHEALPIFAWAAITSTSSSASRGNYNNNKYNQQQLRNDSVLFRARQKVVGDKGFLSLWDSTHPIIREKACSDVVQTIECEHLTTIYLALLSCPMALIDIAYNGRARNNNITVGT